MNRVVAWHLKNVPIIKARHNILGGCIYIFIAFDAAFFEFRIFHI